MYSESFSPECEPTKAHSPFQTEASRICLEFANSDIWQRTVSQYTKISCGSNIVFIEECELVALIKNWKLANESQTSKILMTLHCLFLNTDIDHGLVLLQGHCLYHWDALCLGKDLFSKILRVSPAVRSLQEFLPPALFSMWLPPLRQEYWGLSAQILQEAALRASSRLEFPHWTPLGLWSHSYPKHLLLLGNLYLPQQILHLSYNPESIPESPAQRWDYIQKTLETNYCYLLLASQI